MVEPCTTNGLTLKSVALTRQIRAIDKSRIEEVIGELSDADTAILEATLRKMLGL